MIEKSLHYRRSDNPLRIWKPEMRILDWLYLAFFAVTLLPIRFIGYWITLLFAVLIINIGVIGMDDDKPVSSYYHTFFKTLFYMNIRLHLACFGIFSIKQTGEKADPSDVRVIIGAPHSSYLDAFVIFASYRNMPMVVVNEGVLKAPLIGKAVRFMPCLPVNRSDDSSKERIKAELTKRVLSADDWPQLLVFPEGALTNRRSMMRFKPGGFLPGVPVEPVIIRYNNRLNTTTSINFDPDEGYLYCKSNLLTMCQLYTNVELQILPKYVPGKEEIEDPQIFADNVKELMAKTVGIPVCPKPYRWLKSGGEFLEVFDKATAKLKNFSNAIEEAEENMKKVGNDALEVFDTAVEEMKKLGNDVNEAFGSADEEFNKLGNDAVETFDTIDKEIKKLGNDAIESFVNAAEEMKKLGDDATEAFVSADEEMKMLRNDITEAFGSADEEFNRIGNNAIEAFGTIDKEMKKLGNDAIEAFYTAADEIKKLGNDAREAFDKAGEELKKLGNTHA